MKSQVKILVAVNDVLILKFLEFRLSTEGYEILSARNGKEAIDLMKIHKPALLIMNLILPFVSSNEVLNNLKSNTNLADTPVIVLVSTGLENESIEAFKKGANDFLTIPINPSELLIRVKYLLL